MPRSVKWIAFVVICLSASTFARGAGDAQEVQSVDDVPHELQQLLKIAEQRQSEVKNLVRDYECMIVKRERINGTLQTHRFIEAKVRAARTVKGVKTPLAVRLKFYRPKDIAGRAIVFVEGRDEGQMLVRNGGKRFGNVTVKVDPESELARAETLMHIADMGFERMLSGIIEHLRADIKADPNGENTEMRISREASINDRPCTSVVITHPKQSEGLPFYRTEFFVDNEYHLPVRVVAYDWPPYEGDPPKLMAEFTYTKVRINIGLSDADFDSEVLQTASR